MSSIICQNLLTATGYIYYFDIAALCCLLVLGVAYLTRRNYSNKSNTIFKIMYCCVLIATLSDLGGSHIIEHYKSVPIFVSYLINIAFYLSFSTMGTNILLYVVYVIGKRKINTREKLICSLCLGFETLAIITTPLTKLVFYIDYNDINNVVYHRGVLVPLMYSISFFLLIYSIIIFIKNKKSVSTNQYVTIIFFTLSMIGTIIFQLFVPNLLVECFAMSLFMFTLYFNLQTPDYYVNKLCGCLNSIAFIDYISKKIDKKDKFTIYCFSIGDYQSLLQAIGKDDELILFKKIGTFLTKTFKANRAYGLRNGRFAIVVDKNENNVIELLNDFFAKAIQIEDYSVKIDPYISIIDYPEFSIDINGIIELIDYSLDICFIGKNKVVNVLTNQLIIRKNRENQLIQIMKKALKDKKGFVVNYQPIFNRKSNTFFSLEALLRLKDDNLGLISPNEFIPIAEQNGMIIDISAYSFDRICNFLSNNLDKLKDIKHVEINLSPIEFIQNNLAKRLLEKIKSYNLDPKMFNFEITETTDMKIIPSLKETMDELLSFGCSFSLDDYGTGYSTTKHIVDLPFNTIKIDKSILSAAMEGQDGLTILKFLVKTIKAVRKDIIVEGVETIKMCELLDSLDCNYRQGFYYSKPLSETDLIEFLNK